MILEDNLEGHVTKLHRHHLKRHPCPTLDVRQVTFLCLALVRDNLLIQLRNIFFRAVCARKVGNRLSKPQCHRGRFFSTAQFETNRRRFERVEQVFISLGQLLPPPFLAFRWVLFSSRLVMTLRTLPSPYSNSSTTLSRVKRSSRAIISCFL